MTPLHRKLFRDLWRMKSQALAVALVLACGAMSVTSCTFSRTVRLGMRL